MIPAGIVKQSCITKNLAVFFNEITGTIVKGLMWEIVKETKKVIMLKSVITI